MNELVYLEAFDAISEAIAREKKLKKWKRAWKEELINKFNPEWKRPILGYHAWMIINRHVTPGIFAYAVCKNNLEPTILI